MQNLLTVNSVKAQGLISMMSLVYIISFPDVDDALDLCNIYRGIEALRYLHVEVQVSMEKYHLLALRCT